MKLGQEALAMSPEATTLAPVVAPAQTSLDWLQVVTTRRGARATMTGRVGRSHRGRRPDPPRSRYRAVASHITPELGRVRVARAMSEVVRLVGGRGRVALAGDAAGPRCVCARARP